MSTSGVIGGPEDRDAVTALVGAFLRAVSFEPGGEPGYDRIAGLFVAGGRLIRNLTGDPEVSTVEEFVAPRRRLVADGELTAFEEVEVADVTHVFGNVAHRLSSYRKRGTTGGEDFTGAGIISTQCVRTPDGWRISSMAWDDERPGLLVPAELAALTG